MDGIIGSKQWHLAPMSIHPYNNKTQDMIHSLEMLLTMQWDVLVPELYSNGNGIRNVDGYDVLESEQYKDDIINNLLMQVKEPPTK